MASVEETIANTREARSGFVDAEGARLWYQVAGSGHPLILLHAGLGDARMWDDQVVTFSERYRVVRFDARGFGGSDPARGNYSPRADLAAVMAALGIERAHLVGLSMGGAVALDTALESPSLASALVLVSTRPSGLPASPVLQDGWAAIDAAIGAGEIDRANELELAMWVDGPNRPPDAVVPNVRALIRDMNRALLAELDEGAPLPLDPPAVGRLADITVATLVLTGEEDQPDVLHGSELLARRITGARRGVISGSAHLPNLEQPTAFNHQVLTFLADIA